LRFCTLSIVLFPFKTRNVSETGFCLRLQVQPTQLGPNGRASPCFVFRCSLLGWTQTVELVPVSVFRCNLLGWTQTVELVPVSVFRCNLLGWTQTVELVRLRLQVQPTRLDPNGRASPCLRLQVQPTQMDPIGRGSPCLRLQVQPTQLDPIGRASPCLRTLASESESESLYD
jgi:hypothetical protein